ncbi:MAG: hypothetical protein ACK53Y_26430, partial [bacterium]
APQIMAIHLPFSRREPHSTSKNLLAKTKLSKPRIRKLESKAILTPQLTNSMPHYKDQGRRPFSSCEKTNSQIIFEDMRYGTFFKSVTPHY